MNKTILALVGAVAAPVAMAGTPMSAPITPAAEPSLFNAGWVASPYALFLTPDSDASDDVWGGGLNVEYYFNQFISLGAQGQWADVDGDLGQTYAAITTLRYPVTTHIAPYIQGAFGWQDLGDTSDIFGSASAGVQFRVNEAWGLFADWTYAFPGGGGGDDDFENYQLIRAGFNVSF